MRKVRVLVAAALACGLAAVPFAANASVGIEAGGGAVVTTAQSGNHLYVGTLTADVSPEGVGLVAVAWNCQAEASPAAISTSISECSINGHNAPPTTLPGTASATASTFVFAAGTVVQACITGFASFPEVLLGGQLVVAPRVCQAIQTANL